MFKEHEIEVCSQSLPNRELKWSFWITAVLFSINRWWCIYK